MIASMPDLGIDITKVLDVAHASARCDAIERQELGQAFRPLSRLRTSEWADQYLWLSPEDNGERMKYSSDLTPYHREIMDAMGDIRVRRVVGMLASQLGKTTIMKADAGARIHQRPSPMIWGVPLDKQVRLWSKERLDPMFRDTPVLRDLVVDRTRDKKNTIAWKSFPAGYLALIGMGRPADLAARPCPVVRVDEYNRAPREAGHEGSGLGLLRRRMTKFPYRSLGIFSTPTVKGDCPITEEYESTDQRRHWLPCPRCGEYQILMWGGRDVPWGVKWNNGEPATAHYVCCHCLQGFDDRHRRSMAPKGQWRAEFPDRPDVGFWSNALISPFDGSRFTALAEEFLKTKGNPLELKQFVNTILCEPFEDRTNRLVVGELVTRAEEYPAPVPHGVGVLTRSFDTQDDRLEMAVWGYGADRESWLIDYEYIPGDPSTPKPWRVADELLKKRYRHASGRSIGVLATFIDAMGHHTTQVHAWARRHARDPEPVFAISGDGKAGHPILGKPTFHKSARITTYRVGTWDAKYDFLTRLNGISVPDGWVPGQPIPGYIHLPSWLQEEQFRQLRSEWLSEKVVRNRTVQYWEVRGRNEMLDMAVYCLAALYLLGLKRVFGELGQMAAALSLPFDGGEEAGPAPRQRRVRSGGVAV